jgi:hypothetical protein
MAHTCPQCTLLLAQKAEKAAMNSSAPGNMAAAADSVTQARPFSKRPRLRRASSMADGTAGAATMIVQAAAGAMMPAAPLAASTAVPSTAPPVLQRPSERSFPLLLACASAQRLPAHLLMASALLGADGSRIPPFHLASCQIKCGVVSCRPRAGGLGGASPGQQLSYGHIPAALGS